MRCSGRVYVLDEAELRKTIWDEAHKSRIRIHSGETKMYQDLRQQIWWPSMKRHMTKYIVSCLTCQKAKMEH